MSSCNQKNIKSNFGSIAVVSFNRSPYIFSYSHHDTWKPLWLNIPANPKWMHRIKNNLIKLQSGLKEARRSSEL